MDTNIMEAFLINMLLINYAMLILWFLLFMAARENIYRLHRRWFRLSPETFDAIHYGGMGLYKIGIFLFNLAPLLALWIGR